MNIRGQGLNPSPGI